MWLATTSTEESGVAKGEGIMVFMDEGIRSDLSQWTNCIELECIGLNIVLFPQMTFTLIVIYRPPSSNNDCMITF